MPTGGVSVAFAKLLEIEVRTPDQRPPPIPRPIIDSAKLTPEWLPQGGATARYQALAHRAALR